MSDAWTPDLEASGKPHYLAIADAIAEDIRTGRLPPAARLPPQRQLADRIGINFTTVARGYVEAQRRGLIEARVGQGTFVRAGAPARLAPALARRRDSVDLSMNLPPEPTDPALLARMAQGLAELGPVLLPLLRYQGFGGSAEDKDAARRWLARRGLDASTERILVTPGAHAGLLAAFSVLTRPGDVICTEALTYPGARSLAAQLGLKIVGLPMDAEGIDADALAEACAAHGPKALYLNPTMLNPTTVTISERRRLAIIAVARRFRLPIVEDDAYGLVPVAGPPAFATLAPDITTHISGLAKCMGAGLRLAYLVAPDARSLWPLSAALRTATVMASPITTALATRWIDDGTADDILGFIRSESVARQQIAAEVLPPGSYRADPEGFHLWVELPPAWSRSTFAAHLGGTGIGLVPSDAFATFEGPPEAVRVCLGGAADRATVRRALEYMAHGLAEAPARASAFL